MMARGGNPGAESDTVNTLRCPVVAQLVRVGVDATRLRRSESRVAGSPSPRNRSRSLSPFL